MHKLVTVLLLAGIALTAQDTPVPGRDGWISMFDGKTLEGWKAGDNPESWKAIDGEIVGDGPTSHIFWMTRECENCEFRAEVKLNHAGNSGMYLRAVFGPSFPKGYEAQLENTSQDQQRTGSLYNFAKVTEQLIADNAWFTEDVTARGNHIVIQVNGKTTVDFVDTKNTFMKGLLALQQHNPGSVVHFRNLMMRPLAPESK